MLVRDVVGAGLALREPVAMVHVSRQPLFPAQHWMVAVTTGHRSYRNVLGPD